MTTEDQVETRRCTFCAQQIIPDETSPTGWTHWPGEANHGEPGIQCANRPTQATPEPPTEPQAPPFVDQTALWPPP